MPGDPAARAPVDRAIYLAAERKARDKHILWDGEVFAMAGASIAHNKIVRNLVRRLGNALDGRPCESFSSDLRIFIPAKGGYVYPDASIVCGEIEAEDDEEDTVLNPTVIFEVLSDGTEAFDRGAKFVGYRSIPSFREYVLVSQRDARVDHFVRAADGAWTFRVYEPGATVKIEAAGISLAVDALYDRVRLVSSGTVARAPSRRRPRRPRRR